MQMQCMHAPAQRERHSHIITLLNLTISQQYALIDNEFTADIWADCCSISCVSAYVCVSACMCERGKIEARDWTELRGKRGEWDLKLMSEFTQYRSTTTFSNTFWSVSIHPAATPTYTQMHNYIIWFNSWPQIKTFGNWFNSPQLKYW